MLGACDAVSWDEWFRRFEEERLALCVNDDGTPDLPFFQLVPRDTAAPSTPDRALS